MRTTVRDVAKRAGVSPKTVSNVVNGTSAVSPTTRMRVEAALVELDYVPNLSARGLRNGRAGVIALALPDLNTAYSSELVHYFVQAANRRGLSIQIEETHGGAETEHQLLSRARAHLIDGLVLNPVMLETTAVQRGVSLPPLVLIGEVLQPIADHVWIDNVAAVRDLVAFLVARGHRRIACVGAKATDSARLRVKGYREGLSAAGIAPDPTLEITTVGWDPRAGAEAVTGYLAERPLPDAFLCFTDALAFGVLNVVWARGLNVPDDVSVTGFDDVDQAEFAVPALTTISFDKAAVGETALQMVADRMAAGSAPITTVTLPHRVVVRNSTRQR